MRLPPVNGHQFHPHGDHSICSAGRTRWGKIEALVAVDLIRRYYEQAGRTNYERQLHNPLSAS
jgi:hypothetical protein